MENFDPLEPNVPIDHSHPSGYSSGLPRNDGDFQTRDPINEHHRPTHQYRNPPHEADPELYQPPPFLGPHGEYPGDSAIPIDRDVDRDIKRLRSSLRARLNHGNNLASQARIVPPQGAGSAHHNRSTALEISNFMARELAEYQNGIPLARPQGRQQPSTFPAFHPSTFSPSTFNSIEYPQVRPVAFLIADDGRERPPPITAETRTQAPARPAAPSSRATQQELARFADDMVEWSHMVDGSMREQISEQRRPRRETFRALEMVTADQTERIAEIEASMKALDEKIESLGSLFRELQAGGVEEGGAEAREQAGGS